MEKQKIEERLIEAMVRPIWIKKEKLKEYLEDFLKGKRYYVSKYLDIEIASNEKIEIAEYGIFKAIALSYETGTILAYGDDLASLIPPNSIGILEKGDIKKSLDDLIDLISSNNEKPFVFINGPSKTADIEKKLVIPAHGPKEVILFIIDF